MVLQGASEYFVQEHNKLDKLTYEEVCSLVLFVAATVLSFYTPVIPTILSWIKASIYFFNMCNYIVYNFK